MTLAEAQRRDAIRRQEAKEELERLNRRRAEREAEQRLREEEEIRMQRLAESAQMADWLAKEEDFALEQERTRAAIRIVTFVGRWKVLRRRPLSSKLSGCAPDALRLAASRRRLNHDAARYPPSPSSFTTDSRFARDPAS